MAAAIVVDVLKMAALLTVLSIPLGISAWAFLDVARRPRWVWAFSGRRQVLWMTMIAIGIGTLVGGLVISTYYLTRIRPGLAAIEDGHF